jgi:hypothetical protein
LKNYAANRKRWLSALPNVGPYIYDVKISGFTRSSIYIRHYYTRVKPGEHIINTAKYADHLLLLAKEEMVLRDRIGQLPEIGRCCGMETMWKKQKQ